MQIKVDSLDSFSNLNMFSNQKEVKTIFPRSTIIPTFYGNKLNAEGQQLTNEIHNSMDLLKYGTLAEIYLKIANEEKDIQISEISNLELTKNGESIKEKSNISSGSIFDYQDLYR